MEKIGFETNFVYKNYCALRSADYFCISFKIIFEAINLLSHNWTIFCQATTEYCKICSKKHLNTGSILMTHFQIKLRKRADLQQAYGECCWWKGSVECQVSNLRLSTRSKVHALTGYATSSRVQVKYVIILTRIPLHTSRANPVSADCHPGANSRGCSLML